MQEVYPLKTYIEELDKNIGGFYPGEVTLICGADSFGDESRQFLFALIKLITLGSGALGLVYSYDIMPHNILYKIIGSITGIESYDISESKFDKSKAPLVNAISKQVYDLPLIMRYNPNLYIQELCNEVRKYHRDRGIKIVYLNDLELIGTDESQIEGLGLNEDFFVFNEARYVIEKLAQLAQELNIPIVITYARKGIHVHKKIVKTVNSYLDIENWRTESWSFYHETMRVIKTHDGKIGTFSLSFFSDLNILVFP